MSAPKFVYVVQQWNTDFDIFRVELSELKNTKYYDFDADEEREDPIEFHIDNPDQTLGMLTDEDPEMGDYYDYVEVFSTKKFASEWMRIMYMTFDNTEARKNAAYLWRQRVGFCN